MKLDIGKRLALWSALPREGSFEDLRLIRALRERLTLSEEEAKNSGFCQEKEFSVWDTNFEEEFEFTEGETAAMLKGLKTVSAAGKAQEIHIVVYDLLAENGKSEE